MKTNFASVKQTLNYYRRWPLILGVMAILFRYLSMTNISWHWFFSGAEMFFILVLIGHVASKSQRSIDIAQHAEEQLESTRNNFTQLKKQVRSSSRQIRRLKSNLLPSFKKTKQTAKQLKNMVRRTRGAVSDASARSNQSIAYSQEALSISNSAISTLSSLQSLDSQVRKLAGSCRDIFKSIDSLENNLEQVKLRYFLYLSIKFNESILNQGIDKIDSKVIEQKTKQFHSHLLNLRCTQAPQKNQNDVYSSRQVIVVHQMGKVASNTVYKSLKCLEPLLPVFHTHSLNYKQIEKISKLLIYPKFVGSYEHLIDSLSLLTMLQLDLASTSEQKRDWKIITLVREPIDRNISAFFQNLSLEKLFPSFTTHGQICEEEVDQAIELFLREYSHHLPLNWLDSEIKEVFGIDTFNNAPFDHEKGFQVMEKDNYSVLIIRVEDLNRCCSEAMKDFLNISDFNLRQVNVSSNKKYSSIYKEFKKRIHLPDDYISQMYNSKYATHFYSPSEIREFISRWTKPSK